MTVAEFIRTWGPGSGEVEVGRLHHANRVLHMTKLLPLLGEVELADITHGHVHAIRVWCRQSKGHSPATANRYVASLLAMLRDAELHGLIDIDQVVRVRSKQKMARERPSVAYAAFTAPERDRILEGCQQPRFRFYFPFVAWQFFCGTRPSEALGLHCEDVDLERQWCQVVRSRNGHDVNQDCKTEFARRQFKMPRIVCEALSLLDLARPGEFLFLGPRGRPLDRHNFTNTVWRKLLGELAGVPYRPFEATRHTAITLQLETGNMTPYRAAKYFGTSEAMLMRKYTRSSREWREFDPDEGLEVSDCGRPLWLVAGKVNPVDSPALDSYRPAA